MNPRPKFEWRRLPIQNSLAHLFYRRPNLPDATSLCGKVTRGGTWGASAHGSNICDDCVQGKKERTDEGKSE